MRKSYFHAWRWENHIFTPSFFNLSTLIYLFTLFFMHHLFHSLFFQPVNFQGRSASNTQALFAKSYFSTLENIFGKRCNAAMFAAIHNLENNYFVYDQPLPCGVVGHPTRHIDHVVDRLQTFQGYFLLLDLQCLNLIGWIPSRRDSFEAGPFLSVACTDKLTMLMYILNLNLNCNFFQKPPPSPLFSMSCLLPVTWSEMRVELHLNYPHWIATEYRYFW